MTILDNLGIVDVRPQMAKAPGQGAGYKQGKVGVVVHYNGPANSNPALQQFINDSYFHIGPYLNEYTIAYIYGIGDEPADHSAAPIYLMRDPDDVCWHCGAWPYNASHTPIAFTFGEGQHAGSGQLQSLVNLIKGLQERDGFGDSAVLGHQEVSSTSCPGTLMNDFIYPWRSGQWAGKAPNVSDYLFFTQTGHGYANAFRDYFQKEGGLPVFGYPISDEIDDPHKIQVQGKTMTVQYTERQRLEYHPELPYDPSAPGGGQVLLTRLGAMYAAADGLKGPGI